MMWREPQSVEHSDHLPWDRSGHCSEGDLMAGDLPLYEEAAIEAWVLEHDLLSDPEQAPLPSRDPERPVA